MASPFGVRFFTRGYERTSREMSSIEKKAKWISTGFVRMGRIGASAGPLVARGLGVLKSGLSGAAGVMKTFLGLTLRVTAALGVMGVAVAGVGTVLITKFSKGLMTTRENFYLIETALTGVIKNAAQVRKISEWAMRYAAEFPAMYSDVMDAMKGLAMMPALKPMFTKASVADMEKIMNIVQSLAALDPQQGVKGALLAMREALAGQWRTLQYRFEIRPQAVAAAAGLTMEELKTMPDKAIEALDAFTRLNVGADTLRKSAESLGVQWGNLTDKYEMWLNTIGQYGAYRKLVEFLMKVNDIWDQILDSDAAKRLGQDISRIFEGVIESMQTTITGIDWTGAGMFNGILEAGKAIIAKLQTLFLDTKEIFASSMQIVLIYMQKALLFSIKNIFWPVGVAIADAIVAGFKGAIDAKKQQMIQDLKDVFVEPVIRGPEKPAEMIKDVKETFVKPITEWWQKLTGKPIEVKAKPVETTARPEVEGRVPKPTEEKISVAFDEESKTALKALGDAIKTFAMKYGAMLPERREIPEITPVEEQAKKVVEARSNLRIAELTSTKQLVETLKGQLAYEERLLEYHKKTAEWEEDPKRGKREAQLKLETGELKTGISKDVGAGKTFEQMMEKRAALIEKMIELNELLAQKEKEVGDIKRYAGPELEQKALEFLEKHRDLKAELLNTENQIAMLKIKGGENVNQLIALEIQLFNVIKQRITAEQQIDEINKKQQENANKITELKRTGATEFSALVDLEKESIGLSEAKLKAEQQIASATESQKNVKDQILQLETQIVEKKKESVEAEKEINKEAEKKEETTAHGVALYSKLGQLMAKAAQAVKLRGEFLGTYGKKQVAESAKVALGESEHQRRMAHFQYFSPKEMSKSEADAYLRTSESRLQGELAGAKTLEAQRSILERLYNLNKEQYQRAGTPVVRETEYRDATDIMERLLSVETEQYEENRRIAEIQSANIANIYTETTKTNGLLKLILGKTDFDISTMTAKDVERLRGANPQTTPEFAF